MAISSSRFLDLLERSIIVQGLTMLALTGVIIYLAIADQPIPDLVRDLTVLSFGFYFGGKIENSKSRLLKR